MGKQYQRFQVKTEQHVPKVLKNRVGGCSEKPAKNTSAIRQHF